MKKPRPNVEPITCDFSPWSMLGPGEGSSSVKAFFVSAAIVLTALAAFFGVVHYWR